jgi:hypothetical protein
MAKGQRKTRKIAKASKENTDASLLTIPELRKAFDHMDKVVESLKKVSKHSFSDAVVSYREEWRKTFKRDLPPADAAAYLKFRFGVRSSRAMTRRSKMRGGASLLAGAPLDYQTRPGVDGVYGNFPTYQTQGLDRFYGSAISADCGKPNSFPTDGSGASQQGGGPLDALFRPLATMVPATAPYSTMMEFKGTPPYPTSDHVSKAPLQPIPVANISPGSLSTYNRAYPNM